MRLLVLIWLILVGSAQAQPYLEGGLVRIAPDQLSVRLRNVTGPDITNWTVSRFDFTIKALHAQGGTLGSILTTNYGVHLIGGVSCCGQYTYPGDGLEYDFWQLEATFSALQNFSLATGKQLEIARIQVTPGVDYFLAEDDFEATPTGAFNIQLLDDGFALVDCVDPTDNDPFFEPALPVELTSFTAQLEQDIIVLHWTTAVEEENVGFEIQHRMDEFTRLQQEASAPASAWETLTFVEGAGTTTQPRAYSTRFPDLQPGLHQFRLKQIDYNGHITLSTPVQIELDVPGTHYLASIFPNPFNPQARFSIMVRHTQRVRIEIYDVMGRLVDLLHDAPLSARQHHPFFLDGSTWSSGSYTVRILGEDFTDTRRITLIK